MTWFRARANDHHAKMFITEDDNGYQVEKLSVWKHGEDNSIPLKDIEQLEPYGFDIESLWLDIEDWYENERETKENYL